MIGTTEITEGDARFATGVPVRFPFARYPVPAPDMGSTFGQDIEPVGRYMITVSSGMDVNHLHDQGWETGEMAFSRPLVIEHGGYGSDGWKARLTAHYGLTGSALSAALWAEGFDGIVTVSMSAPDGGPGYVSEVVQL